MNRKELERHLREHGCVLHHHGGRHDVWLNLAEPGEVADSKTPTIEAWQGPGDLPHPRRSFAGELVNRHFEIVKIAD